MAEKKAPRFGRFTLTFLCCVAGIPICCSLLEGMNADTVQAVVFSGCVLGVVYLLLRPLLRLLSAPIGCLTLGLSGFLIDTGLILLLPRLVEGFHVESFVWALLCSVLINGMCLITGGRR